MVDIVKGMGREGWLSFIISRARAVRIAQSYSAAIAIGKQIANLVKFNSNFDAELNNRRLVSYVLRTSCLSVQYRKAGKVSVLVSRMK